MTMITLERTRELLKDPNLSDTEIQEIRNTFYALADLFLDDMEAKKLTKNEYEDRN